MDGKYVYYLDVIYCKMIINPINSRTTEYTEKIKLFFLKLCCGE